MEWWSPYSSIHIRRIIDSSSRIKYDTAPYANTFTYYGMQFKFNGQEIKNKTIENFRETYQFALLFGRQTELTRKNSFVSDFYIGIGCISNYKLSAFEPKLLIGARIGLNIWGVNK